MRIYRKIGDGKKWPAVQVDGHFVLGNPKYGNTKHHAENAVRVRTEDEAIALLRKGYSIRVETATSPSLVRRNLFVDGQPLDG